MEDFFLIFVPVVVAMDPLGNVPLFLSLARGVDRAGRRRMIRQAVVTALLAGALFVFGGRAVFIFLGITPYDFQIAGGLVLLVLSFADLFGYRRKYETTRGDTGIVPLGMPLVAGPAVLTTLVIMVELYNREPYGPTGAVLLVSGAYVAALGLSAAAFAFADQLSARLGLNVLRALERIINLLLAAFAVMMIRRGVEGLLGHLR